MTERRTCRLSGTNRSSKRYAALNNEKDSEIKEHLLALAARWKSFGYRRLHIMLKKENININHKRTSRLYKSAGLTLKK
ncbi:MAG: IS3 family transposase [Acidaminococcaceae bacterium]